MLVIGTIMWVAFVHMCSSLPESSAAYIAETMIRCGEVGGIVSLVSWAREKRVQRSNGASESGICVANKVEDHGAARAEV